MSDWLAQGRHDPVFIATALLLVSELVTNSVRHARIEPEQPLRLCVSLREATLRLELWDGGIDGTVAPRPPRRDANVGGFGLDLVARLSSAWGVTRDTQGTTVWLEIPTATGVTT